MANKEKLIKLNVGGHQYTTTLQTLTNEPNNLLIELVETNKSKDEIFIDRDGVLFRFILDYLRNSDVLLPENFTEKALLKREASYFKLENLEKQLSDLNIDLTSKVSVGGCITVGYRGTFSNGRDGMNDVKFRKISRILVMGRVQLCREVFGEQLNESRNPDSYSERYTSRFFLKHTFLEQAFESLIQCGFILSAAAASGTSNQPTERDKLLIPDNEETKWLHYNEFVFVKKD